MQPVVNGPEHAIAVYEGAIFTHINDERLSGITKGTDSYQLFYDALGRCVKRTLNGTVTWYLYDGEKPIVEYNATGGIVASNIYGKGIDEILQRTDATFGTYYFQQDHEGSVTHLTNAAGQIIEKYRYDAFGAPTIFNSTSQSITSSAFGNRFLFTGREYLAKFGIYEYRARAYHPGLGRFMSEDPIGFSACDYNLYRYCGNDPLDRIDPSGLIDSSTGRSGLASSEFQQQVQDTESAIDAAIKIWERQMAVSNEEISGSARVEWTATAKSVHNPGEKFAPGVAAKTEWQVKSTARIQDGKVVGFRNELQMKITWNDAKIKSAEFRQYVGRVFHKEVGEIAHARDALAAARYSRSGGDAWNVANSTARGLIGKTMSALDAQIAMERPLVSWSINSMDASQRRWDKPDIPGYQDGHVYGFFR